MDLRLTILKLLLIIICSSYCLQSCKKNKSNNSTNQVVRDNHVHVMSPHLISDWKAIGIPFSKPDPYYSDIDTILKQNEANFTNLIGMAYVYGSPEFYQGEDAYQLVKRENNYLLDISKHKEKNIKPFLGIDPLKEYAIEEINRCLKANNNVGLKLHFSASQVYLTEPEHLKKIKRVFKIASRNKMPILLHFDNWHPKFGKPDMEILIDSILTHLDPIHLTIAHFGSSGGFNQKTKNVIDTFVELYEKDRISKKHTILFDISAVALDKDSEGVKKLTDGEFMELKRYCDKLGYDKIVFGTDYPLYTVEEYIDILKTKLKLSESNLEILLANGVLKK